MTPEILTSSLQLSVPELMLAVGAMVLLMVGVFSGEKSVTMVNGRFVMAAPVASRSSAPT